MSVEHQRMKGQGNQGKNVEERSIPWSQQVDEASYENLSSPTEGNQSGSSAGGTQFQYPPFNSKDGGSSSHPSGNNSKRNNYQNDVERYGHQSHNNFSRNGEHNNSWNQKQMNTSHQNYNRRSNHYDDNYRSDRNNQYGTNDYKQPIQRGVQNLSIDNENIRNTSNNRNNEDENTNSMSANNNKNSSDKQQQQQTVSASKQMTWASIASQPAKPTLRASSTSSTLKKKGPGMPPPPMVPGKHNMDIGTWDSPKNGPVLVPPPPIPVIPVPIPEQQSQTKSRDNAKQRNAVSGGGDNENNRNQQQQTAQQHPQRSFDRYQNQQQQSTKGPSSVGNENVRPPWVANQNHSQQPQQQNIQHNNHHQNQQQHHQNNSRNNYRPTYGRQDNDDYRAEQNRGEQNRGEQNRSEQSRGEQNRGEQNRSEQNRGEQNRAEQTRGERLERGEQNRGGYRQHQQNPPSQPTSLSGPPVSVSPTPSNTSSNPAEFLHELHNKNNYNPLELDLENAHLARFFVIKSYSEDDIHRSIKYEIWCSTERGNIRLDEAFQEREQAGGIIYLLFSVNGSGHFCGVAQMLTRVDYNTVVPVWSQNKWKGAFKVKWIYVKDVPNASLRHIRIASNENKPVTNSRDTQEVPNHQGIQVLKIIHECKNGTSIFDDFVHYELRQEAESSKKHEPAPNERYESGNGSRYRGSSDYERGSGDRSYQQGSSFRENRNFSGRGGYHNNFDNRRNNDEYTRDRNQRGDSKDSDSQPSHYNNNRENGDYQSRGGFHRGGFNNRDRESNSGGFMNRADNRPQGGSFRDNNRDNFNRNKNSASSSNNTNWRAQQRSFETPEKTEN